jgi:HTH-type transcriptional regulator/antitoxin HigA
MQQSSTLPGLTQAWKALQGFALLSPIRNNADFQRIHALADDLADEVGDDVNHPLFSLFEIVMDLMDHWEDEHVSIPDAAPHEVLRYLLAENGLKQKDLSDIASPTLISDILSGRRAISKKLAISLAERFNVNVTAFL